MKRITIEMTDEQREELRRIIASGKSENRLVTRAKIVLDAVGGMTAAESARRHGVTRPTVVK